MTSVRAKARPMRGGEIATAPSGSSPLPGDGEKNERAVAGRGRAPVAQTQPVGLGRPAILHACLAGP